MATSAALMTATPGMTRKSRTEPGPPDRRGCRRRLRRRQRWRPTTRRPTATRRAHNVNEARPITPKLNTWACEPAPKPTSMRRPDWADHRSAAGSRRGQLRYLVGRRIPRINSVVWECGRIAGRGGAEWRVRCSRSVRRPCGPSFTCSSSLGCPAIVSCRDAPFSARRDTTCVSERTLRPQTEDDVAVARDEVASSRRMGAELPGWREG